MPESKDVSVTIEVKTNSSTPHRFTPRRMERYEAWNHNECGACGMPRTHRVHPQADRGAMGHFRDDDYTSCYDESHWERPIVTNEGAVGDGRNGHAHGRSMKLCYAVHDG